MVEVAPAGGPSVADAPSTRSIATTKPIVLFIPGPSAEWLWGEGTNQASHERLTSRGVDARDVRSHSCPGVRHAEVPRKQLEENHAIRTADLPGHHTTA